MAFIVTVSNWQLQWLVVNKWGVEKLIKTIKDLAGETAVCVCVCVHAMQNKSLMEMLIHRQTDK